MAGLDIGSILNLVSGEGVAALGKVAGADEKSVSTVVSTALPLLVGKMQSNVSSRDGAVSLGKALSEHAGADISDVGSFLTNADGKDGKKILAHILGDDQTAVTKAISKKSGLTSSKVTKILAQLAPLLLTLLGNGKQDEDNSSNSLSGLLQGVLGNSNASGLLGGLLGGSSSGSSSSNGLLGGLLGK